jgi:hypothetical protein
MAEENAPGGFKPRRFAVLSVCLASCRRDYYGGIMVSWNKEQDDEKEDLSGLLVMVRSVFR